MEIEISVIIPTHRRHSQLMALLDSLAGQDIDPRRVEIRVVSNLADSELERKIIGCKKNWPGPVHFLVSGKLGVNRARNLGLDTCVGRIALFLDDDCLLPSRSFLRHCLRVHAEEAEALAVGGAYLTAEKTGRVSARYNQICNCWIGAQFLSRQASPRLLGGSVSYKVDRLRLYDFRFAERIVYGGSETELHERMVSAGHKLIFDPAHSVAHDGRVSLLGLVRKAYFQGLGKIRNREGAPREEVSASSEVQSICGFVYRRSFNLGQRLGRHAPERKLDINIIYLLLVLSCLAFPAELVGQFARRVYWLVYGFMSRAKGEARRLAVHGYWLMYRWATGIYWRVYARATKIYWFHYALGSKIYWFLYACVTRMYWPLYARATKVYWFHYALGSKIYWLLYAHVTKMYWLLYARATKIYWFLYARVTKIYWFLWRNAHQIKKRAIHAYWAAYPIFSHLKHNWRRPLSLLNVKIPLTYPALETATKALWVARINESHAHPVSREQVEEWTKLGLSAVEFRAEFALKHPGFCEWVDDLERAGLDCHVMIPALGEIHPNDIARCRPFVVIQTSQINTQLEEILSWLDRSSRPYDLQIRLDAETRKDKSRRCFSRLKEMKLIHSLSLVLASEREGDRRVKFLQFRRLHRFSAQIEDLGIPWRPYYRYAKVEEYKIVGANSSAAYSLASAPKVTLIIPHHCDFTNLCASLQQLTKQSLAAEDFEVIVIDNALQPSLLTPPEREHLLQIGGGLRLTILTMESFSAGIFLAGHARNEGLLLARGELIQFMDSDILLPHDFLARLVEQMVNVDVVMAKRFMLKESFAPHSALDEVGGEDCYGEDEYWENFKRAKLWTDLPDYWKYSCSYCYAVKRADLMVTGPFDPRFTTYGFEDVDLGFRLFKLNKKFAFASVWVYHLYPRRALHNYHFDLEKRRRSLENSALTLFQLRPERLTFALCQGYFAPRLGERLWPFHSRDWS